jgi:4-amino-4-deoxy-L-arabinose transferase-like glycosyltransferase
MNSYLNQTGLVAAHHGRADMVANLEYRKLVKPDEGRYAEIPREMVVSGDWTTPRLNELKYFEKPPLQYWATALAYKVFGEHQWTSRLWAALTGFLGVLLAWFAGTRLFGRQAGAMHIAIQQHVVCMMAHHTLDMATFFSPWASSDYCRLAQADRKQRNWMLVGGPGPRC